MMIIFFFNVNNDLRGKPIICKGSGSQHFRLLFSSKRLLQNVEHVGVFHVDGTYKITIQDFPLVVFGVTDLKGVFHPICFMITSHETEEDFYYMYHGLHIQCEIMELEWRPSFIMQDAQQSSYNAIKRLFPDVEVLMCYYHVTENIRKKCKQYIDNREDVYEELKAAVQEMHMSSNEEEYQKLKKDFKDT
jgi:hypothetical protein